MAKLSFSNFYTRPGKGVSKDSQEKHRFFLFFELYFRKFSKLLLLNLIYLVIIFPLISYGVIWLMGMLNVDLEQFLVNGDLIMTLFTYFIYGLPSPVPQILVGLSAILMGPATAGATYIWRNFARQEHSWVWTDFWERLKSNFRQGLVLGILDLLVLVSFVLYMTINTTGNDSLDQYMLLFRYVVIFIGLVYLFMRNYTYLIAVTFEMSIIAIIRNAWIFAVLGIVRNFCTLVFTALVLLATCYAPIPMLLIVTCSLCGFISTFNAWPVVEKYMMAPRAQSEDGTITIVDPSELPEPESKALFADDMSSDNREDEE